MNDFSEGFLTKVKFTKLIEETVIINRVSYIDAILIVCEKNDLEVEDVKKYISSVIKDKLEVEAMDLNYMPKSNTLPFD